MTDNPRQPPGDEQWNEPSIHVGERRRRAQLNRLSADPEADAVAAAAADPPTEFDDAGIDGDVIDEVTTIRDDWVDYNRPRFGSRRWLIAVGSIVVVLLLVLGSVAWWVNRQINPTGLPGEAVELEIPEGASTSGIGKLLADEGVITSSTIWDYWTRFRSKGPFQAGFYTFQKNSSFQDAVDVLDAGPLPPTNVSVTIPEGLRLFEVIERLGEDVGVGWWSVDRFQAVLDNAQVSSSLSPDGVSLEGLLFPATYEVDEDVDEVTFLNRLARQMEQVVDRALAEAPAIPLGLTTYEMLVVASMVEAETRVDSERPRVARVIYNRIERGMALGIDATSCYEIRERPCRLTTAILQSDSPYNTRHSPGLPPTPIGAPGRASIEAALLPEDGPWIYYVLADEAGNHFFTDSAAEFERAKQECIRLGLGCG